MQILFVSEAFSVNDRWTRLVVLLFVYPHGLESTEGGQDGTTEPYTEFPLWRGQYLDFVCARGQLMDLLPHSFTHSIEEGGTTRQNDVLEEVLSNVYIALLHGGVAVLMNTI